MARGCRECIDRKATLIGKTSYPQAANCLENDFGGPWGFTWAANNPRQSPASPAGPILGPGPWDEHTPSVLFGM
jgi:hypothetical protein